MATNLRTVVVIGGSYVGLAATKALANSLPATHRVLLIEPHSHFNHLFAFPRFAVLPSHEHKAFIPYASVFTGCPNAKHHAIVKARVVEVTPKCVVLDREWQQSNEISFDYLVIATGTRRPTPFEMTCHDKPDSVKFLRSYQLRVLKAKSILIIGGGANGVQIAADIKEMYPEKDVTLAHSRQQLMPEFHQDLDALIKARFRDLGIKRLMLGRRINASIFDGKANGHTPDITGFDPKTINPDLVIPAIGQVPNTAILKSLPAVPGQTLVNPQNGFIRVRPTLQLDAVQYPHIYALGDVADTGARKAARPGVAQAECIAKNIISAIQGKMPKARITVTPPGIHMTLGLKQSVLFRNPNPEEGRLEPTVTVKDDGSADMGIEGVWRRRGIEVTDPKEYYL